MPIGREDDQYIQSRRPKDPGSGQGSRWLAAQQWQIDGSQIRSELGKAMEEGETRRLRC
jgi:hypothetical protein